MKQRTTHWYKAGFDIVDPAKDYEVKTLSYPKSPVMTEAEVTKMYARGLYFMRGDHLYSKRVIENYYEENSGWNYRYVVAGKVKRLRMKQIAYCAVGTNYDIKKGEVLCKIKTISIKFYMVIVWIGCNKLRINPLI